MYQSDLLYRREDTDLSDLLCDGKLHHYLLGWVVLEDLYQAERLRQSQPQDQLTQDLLGPENHRQFVKEVTQRNPMLGLLLAAGAPFYTALKILGINSGGTGEMKTSKPSLDEIFAAYQGFDEGR